MKKNKIKYSNRLNSDLNFNILNNLIVFDFFTFQRKFCGVFVFKGKKAYSIKTFDYLLNGLKVALRKNPIFLFKTITSTLVPFFLLGQKKQGKRIVYLPILAKGNKKNRFMLNWLVRQLKGRSNVIGVKKEDVLKLLLETYNNKGSAVGLKRDFYNQAMANKFNLKRSRFARKSIYKWQFDEKKKLQQQQERELLLTIMTEDKIEEWKKKKEKKKLFRFFRKKFSKNSSYKNYLVR